QSKAFSTRLASIIQRHSMPSRLLVLRIWLEKNDLFPKGKLALITIYLLALDLLLFAVQKIVALVRSSYGDYLRGWIIFLTVIVIVLLSVLAARWLSSRLLWRMRNRLLVTYAFIGVIPLVLLVGLGGLAFYLFSGQFATYIVTSKLNEEVTALQESNQVIARELAAALAQGNKSDVIVGNRLSVWNDRQLSAWLDGKLLLNQPAHDQVSGPPSFPSYLPAQFSQVVRENGNLFVRAATSTAATGGRLTVISSKPLDQRLLIEISAGLGEVTLYSSGLSLRKVQSTEPAQIATSSADQCGSRYDLEIASLTPTLTVGNVPPPTQLLDGQVNFPTAICVVNWLNGDTSQPAAIAIQTRLFALNQHLFSSLG